MNSPINPASYKAVFATAVKESNVESIRESLNFFDLSDPRSRRIDEPVEAEDEKKLTIAHYAAISNNLKMLEVAIDYHADLNVRDASNATPLNLAIRFGSHECILKLVENGAQVDCPFQNQNGESFDDLVTFAAAEDKVDLLEVLRIAGYISDCQDSNSRKSSAILPFSSPFEIAVKNNSFQAAEYFVKHGLIPDKKQLIAFSRLLRLTKKSNQAVNYIDESILKNF